MAKYYIIKNNSGQLTESLNSWNGPYDDANYENEWLNCCQEHCKDGNFLYLIKVENDEVQEINRIYG